MISQKFIGFVSLLFLLIFTFSQSAIGQDASPKSNNPGTVSTATGSPNLTAWTLTTGNLLPATIALGNNKTSELLSANNFGFNIPTGSTINGIQITLKRTQSVTGGASDKSLKLFFGASSSVDITSSQAWGTENTEQTVTYGSTSSLWGKTWSVAEINSSAFGIKYDIRNGNSGSNNISISSISITVHFTPPTPTIALTRTPSGNIDVASRATYTITRTGSTTNALTVDLSSTSGGSFYKTLSGTETATQAIIPAGKDTTKFYFGSSTAATYTVTASAEGFSDATNEIVVENLPTLTLSSPNNITAGAGRAMYTVSRSNNSNIIINLSSTGDGAFYSSSSGGSPIPSVDLNGNSSETATFYFQSASNSAGSYTITATATGYVNATDEISILPAAASTSVSTFTASSTTLAVANPGQTSTLTLQLKDAFGNTTTTNETVTMSLVTGSVASSVGTVTDNGNGNYTATFTGGTVPGTATIEAKFGSSTVTTKPVITINAGAPSALSIVELNPANPIKGVNHGILTFQLLDQYNNVTRNTTGSDITVTMTSNYPFVRFDNNSTLENKIVISNESEDAETSTSTFSFNYIKFTQSTKLEGEGSGYKKDAKITISAENLAEASTNLFDIKEGVFYRPSATQSNITALNGVLTGEWYQFTWEKSEDAGQTYNVISGSAPYFFSEKAIVEIPEGFHVKIGNLLPPPKTAEINNGYSGTVSLYNLILEGTLELLPGGTLNLNHIEGDDSDYNLHVHGTFINSGGTFNNTNLAYPIDFHGGHYVHNHPTFSAISNLIPKANWYSRGEDPSTLTLQKAATNGLNQNFQDVTIHSDLGNFFSLSGNTSATNLTISSGVLDLNEHDLSVSGEMHVGELGFITGNPLSKLSLGGPSTLNFNQPVTSAAKTSIIYFPALSELVVNTTNPSDVVSITPSLDIYDKLTLTKGIVDMGENIMILNAEAIVEGGSQDSYVSGSMRRNIPNSMPSSLSFPIGNANAYAPANITFTSGPGGTALTASTYALEGAPPTESGLSQDRYLGRGWSITGDEVSANKLAVDANYGITFGFPSSDIVGGADPNRFLVRKRSGETWENGVTGERSANSVSASGFSSFSDFYVGETAASYGFSGIVFDDLNANGRQDNGEPGLAGWSIRAQSSTLAAETTTDANGVFTFEELSAGTYFVTQTLQDEWTQSTPANETVRVNLGPEFNPAQVVFGNWKKASLSGTLFNDADGSTSYNEGESVYEGITVRLYNGLQYTTTVTDANGAYTFADLKPGTYRLSVNVLPPNSQQSVPGEESAYAYTRTLQSGDALEGLDFGFYETITLEGQIVIRNTPGKIIPEAFSGNTVPRGVIITGTRTGPAPEKRALPAQINSGFTSFEVEADENGYFMVNQMLPGSYSITVTLPDFWENVGEKVIQTTLTQGVVIEVEFAIAFNEEMAPEVFGSAVVGTIQDHFNGLFSDGKTGLGGISLSIEGTSKRGTEVKATTKSASDGTYRFDELPAGSYTVSLSLPENISMAAPFQTNYFVDLAKNQTLGSTFKKGLPVNTLYAESDTTVVRMSMLIDINRDGIADTEFNLNGTAVFELQGFAGDPSRTFRMKQVSLSGRGPKDEIVKVIGPGLYSPRGTYQSNGDVTLNNAYTIVIEDDVFYMESLSEIKGKLEEWPARNVIFGKESIASAMVRDPFGRPAFVIKHIELVPLHGLDFTLEKADFGDAPNTYGTNRNRNLGIPVLMNRRLRFPNEGPRHLLPILGESPRTLGFWVFPTRDGLASEMADADKGDDGLIIGDALIIGEPMTFIVGGTGTGYLQAWADWNANGSFDDDEQIVKDHPFSGSDTLSVAIPSTAKPGTTFLRIRYSSVKGIWAKGLAPDGEVEDYRIILLAPLTENDDDEDGDDDGNTGTPTSDEDDRSALPTSFALGQNYPNPFNPTTVIPFDLAAAGQVNIAVYDITGRLVKQLVNETMRAGRHTVTFNAVGIPSGVYMVRMTAGGQVITGKVALVK